MSIEKKLLVQDAERRLCKESIPRILKCIDHLNNDEIWWRENEQSNSIGNLILHLDGNVRQWIFSGLMGDQDQRNRKLEFSSNNEREPDYLKNLLFTLEDELVNRLPNIVNLDLTATKTIQGIRENGVSILIHVVEHFSYHTGQIAFITKRLKNMDLGFYSSKHLNDLNP